MISSPPGRAAAALLMAKAAAAFEGDPRAEQALDLALSMGADPSACLAMMATMGCPRLLALCVAAGGDPLARALPYPGEPLFVAEDPEGFGPSPLSRAILSGSAPCVAILRAAGADPLSDSSLAPILARQQDDGVSRWDAALAALTQCAPNPAPAHELLVALSSAAAKLYRQPREDIQAEAAKSHAVIARLAELGASLGAPSRESSRDKTVGSELFELACDHCGRGARTAGVGHALLDLARLCSALDPIGAPSGLRSAMRQIALSAGGAASALPEPDLVAFLRQAADAMAMACPAEDPAARALMAHALDGMDRGVLKGEGARRSAAKEKPLAERASRKSMAWLEETAASWTAPSPSALAFAQEQMAQCLAASALAFGVAADAPGRDVPASAVAPEQWLDWALSTAVGPRLAKPGAAWPLMAARVAAASSPELRASFERMAPAAAILATPCDDAQLTQSRLLAIRIADSAGGPRASSAPAMRI